MQLPCVRSMGIGSAGYRDCEEWYTVDVRFVMDREHIMRMKMAATGVLVGLMLALAGCEVKTGDSWDHRVVLASDLTPSAVDGQWEGQWQSHEFLDNGLIHFVIVPSDV